MWLCSFFTAAAPFLFEFFLRFLHLFFVHSSSELKTNMSFILVSLICLHLFWWWWWCCCCCCCFSPSIFTFCSLFKITQNHVASAHTMIAYDKHVVPTWILKSHNNSNETNYHCKEERQRKTERNNQNETEPKQSRFVLCALTPIFGRFCGGLPIYSCSCIIYV